MPQGIYPPPPGVTPTFDPDNAYLWTANKAVITAGLILSTSSLVLRVYTKAHLLHKFGWDDVSIICAWIFAVATQAMAIYGFRKGGLGLHKWDLTVEMFDIYQKVVLIAAIVYVPALAFAKISLIILYYRILAQQKFYRWALYILSFVVAGYSFAIMFALIFACHPIQKSWDASITDGGCIDQKSLYVFTAAMNIVTDVFLIGLPIRTVTNLNMPTVQKVGLLLMFIIGCATVVTSIVRLAVIVPFLNTDDPTYKISMPQLWANIESNFIIICGCLPFFRQFLRRHAPGLIGEQGSTAPRYNNYYTYGSSSRRRKPGLTMLQDDVELAARPESTHSEVRIVKEVQWEVKEERRDENAR
ncbi:hypothetical protein ASPWEDRAFT_43485 [Aspergillus wentii DTO 134E9]|uniref:Rhodopsin domain-containing protein n=1 Tax=Aspergillus wentii DTO 134E9 TaxID=1073089 RepID=A0A1L9RES3_ASPWE|nr:uncharacterized protein ASPWEDRAFT_43485 [Aspergillus wentii DTO 134E9]OJJ33425.1 hypothetical protein ASPWEDRAFT_43485 [Aspergillus wentii DTO 134E9]